MAYLPINKHLDEMDQRGQPKGDGKHQVPLIARVEAVVGVAGVGRDPAVVVGDGGGACWFG